MLYYDDCEGLAQREVSQQADGDDDTKGRAQRDDEDDSKDDLSDLFESKDLDGEDEGEFPDSPGGLPIAADDDDDDAEDNTRWIPFRGSEESE